MSEEYKFTVEWTENATSDSLDLLIQSPSLHDGQKQILKKTVNDWADEGIEKGYGGNGYMHYIESDPKWETIDSKDYFEAFIDMGTAGAIAIDILLERLAATNIPIEKVYFGENTIGIKEQKGLL